MFYIIIIVLVVAVLITEFLKLSYLRNLDHNIRNIIKGLNQWRDIITEWREEDKK